MKYIEKIILVIYSIIIFILSTFSILLVFRLINSENIYYFINSILNNTVYSVITISISIIFILISIKCIFFLSKNSDYYKDNICLKNDEGKLIITKATIDNLVSNALKGFESAQNIIVKSKFDKENNIIIDIKILINENSSIQDLSNNIQQKIKDIIKKSSGLSVKEINVRVNNITKKERNGE